MRGQPSSRSTTDRSVENERIGSRPSTEELWDRALVMRLAEGAGDGGILYGLATDDAHDHYTNGVVSIPGRGWIMGRSERLEPDAIIDAMKRGDFYASSGVTLEEVAFEIHLTVGIEEEGVQYFTEFIGTRIETVSILRRTGLLVTDANPRCTR